MIVLSQNIIFVVFQIKNYIIASRQFYLFNEVKVLISNIIIHHFKFVVRRFVEFKIKQTQRFQFVDLSSYLVEWIIDRDKFLRDVKSFVNYYRKHYENLISNVVISSTKSYFIEITFDRFAFSIFYCSSMQRLKDNYLKIINKLIFQFIEKQNDFTINLINSSNFLEDFDFDISFTNNVSSISNISFVIRLLIIEQFSFTSFFTIMSKTKFIE